ncbi:MarR family winged helix-turn-helix transcriptional regulator [Amycolatopsis anabasis]|uniref:MarR family winged helix-turn-helix transcriptional regulator n=1 Tax=Amycolatopsis anabasis TaxID=1840409 RepID=UPI001FE3AF48|nr:MarR family transcriptional regulator [Amycolatopsis anabasis]
MGNVLGAAALAVSDLLLAGVTGASGISASGAAALIVLRASPGLSVTELGRRIGLSQPAAARMVDSLEARDLVERQRGAGKEVAVRATEGGLNTAYRILSARGGRLAGLVAKLDESERETLDRLLGKLLTGAYEEVRSSERLCRLCDRAACVADGWDCPVGAAERAQLAG